MVGLASVSVELFGHVGGGFGFSGTEFSVEGLFGSSGRFGKLGRFGILERF
jgi:hypothetical protein